MQPSPLEGGYGSMFLKNRSAAAQGAEPQRAAGIPIVSQKPPPRPHQQQQHGAASAPRRGHQARPPAGPRETGVVGVVKDNFGFIRCADREGDIYFNLGAAPSGISPGTEVSSCLNAERCLTLALDSPERGFLAGILFSGGARGSGFGGGPRGARPRHRGL